MRLNVYGVSDWVEDRGEKFLIFEDKEFVSEAEAIAKAQQEYSPDLEIILEPA